MWLSAWVEHWAIDLIAESGDSASVDVSSRRTIDDGTAVVGFVSNRNYFLGQFILLGYGPQEQPLLNGSLMIRKLKCC